MSSYKYIFELIEEDWKRYPYKKLYCLQNMEIKVKEILRKITNRNNKKDKKVTSTISLILISLTGLCPAFTYVFWFRLAGLNGIMGLVSKFKHRRLFQKYGVYIPRNTSIGGGLVIWHPISIVINPKAIIGKNCDLFQMVTIGEWNHSAASIGDNVYIGPNTSIVGGVMIGNNVKIGSGTVVIKDIPDNCTSVGNPNRNIFK